MIFDYIKGLYEQLANLVPAGHSDYKCLETGWDSRVRCLLFHNYRFRRAYFQLIDHSQDRGLMVLHATVFPHYNDPSPIFGFDIVSGANKVTGAFYDFSLPGYPGHTMSQWFAEQVHYIKWQRNRELPEWAMKIFSADHVSVGNMRDIDDIRRFGDMGIKGLQYYFDNVGLTQQSLGQYNQLQDLYCRQQKKNVRAVSSMVALGYPEDEVRHHIDVNMFPESEKSWLHAAV